MVIIIQKFSCATCLYRIVNSLLFVCEIPRREGRQLPGAIRKRESLDNHGGYDCGLCQSAQPEMMSAYCNMCSRHLISVQDRLWLPTIRRDEVSCFKKAGRE